MRILKWVKRVVIALFGLAALLLITGFVFEQISRSKAAKIPANGSFGLIGDHRLHYLKKGQGGPTVVFETAFDPAGHLQWYQIQESLSSHSTTFSYDRAGIVWSERGTSPKTGRVIADELHLLLERSGAPKPYILVGHSFGGVLIRFFIDQYPQDVAGVVLLDSQHPDSDQYLSPALQQMVNKGLPANFLRFANTFGMARLMFRNMFPSSSEYNYQNTLMPALLYKSADGILEEQDEMAAIKSEASKINSFHSIPLWVVSAADEHRYDGFIKEEKLKKEMLIAWENMQKNLLQLSTQSRQLQLPNSGHYINQDQPKVIEEILITMINDIRSQEKIWRK